MTNNRGLIAISTVLLISAVVMASVITISRLSIGEAQSSLSVAKGEEELALVESCVEDLLQRVHDNSSFSLTSTTISPEIATNGCNYTYTLGGPTNWDVTVTATPSNIAASEFKRKIRVVFIRGASAITITSWQEI